MPSHADSAAVGRKKELNDAWTRFRSAMAKVDASLSALVSDIKKRRKKKLLQEAWARFRSKMADIRKRTVSLMGQIEKKRSEKLIEEARRKLDDI